MIRNVVIHMANEQPLLADLFDLPSPADAGLVCTNVRQIDGKKPVEQRRRRSQSARMERKHRPVDR